jgi:hypothetical protein
MTTPPRPDAHDREPLAPVDAALADALAGAGRALAEAPTDAVASAHLAAIHEAAATHAHAGPTAAVAARPWPVRVRRVLGLTAVKVALGVGVAAAATGGLAAGGNLPDPVQGVVSDGARWFGIEVPPPTPRDRAPIEVPAGPDVVEDGDVPVDAPPAPVVPVPVDPAPEGDGAVEAPEDPGPVEVPDEEQPPAGPPADAPADPPVDAPDDGDGDEDDQGPPADAPVPDRPGAPDGAGEPDDDGPPADRAPQRAPASAGTGPTDDGPGPRS